MSEDNAVNKGFWSTLPVVTKDQQRPKLKWNLNEEHYVVFEGEPQEWDSVHGEGVFYTFNVVGPDAQRYVIMTSSKTLLYGIRALGEDITGVHAKIRKVMKPWNTAEGKKNLQCYEVAHVHVEDYDQQMVEEYQRGLK